MQFPKNTLWFLGVYIYIRFYLKIAKFDFGVTRGKFHSPKKNPRLVFYRKELKNG